MWVKSDILALLQLFTMIALAAIHALWCLILHRSKLVLPAQVLHIFVLISFK
jgi:hypothetical protein